MGNQVKSYNKRLEALRSERSTFIDLWRQCSDYHLAHRGRFLTSDRNKGHKRNTRQYNNTSRLAVRTLASGMMAGITSPARPWFRLGPSDQGLRDRHAVSMWLHQVQNIMYDVFSQSNIYNSLHQIYAELGVFGTAAMGVYEDFENVIFCAPYTAGSYMLGADGRGRIDTFYREYDLSVAQTVKQFGIDKCSNEVQQRWRNGNTESWVTIIHCVEPNDDRDRMSPLASDKPVRSVYYEKSLKSQQNAPFLRESGFDDFPVLAPRWDVTAEDVYATDCPGMTTLGDTKALQLGERRKYQAIDKLVDPPLQGPASLKNRWNSIKAGEILWVDNVEQAMSSVYGNYRPDINVIMTVNQEAEGRIKRGFYEDLFLMLANSDRRQITAREVAEKHEEKLLMLGPVLERLHAELLDPLIDRTFNILQKNGVLPPPPPELANVDLKVEYVSVLAQAQRLVSVGSLDRLTEFTGNLAQIWPSARFKYDADAAVDEYADALGVDPRIIRSSDQVAAMQQAEQQQQQAAQAGQAAQQMAETAKTASETDTGGGENALSAVMRRAGLA